METETGTGTIRVEINQGPYEATDVRGREYLGFFCSGDIVGNKLWFALGNNPQVGDTLKFDRIRPAFAPIYVSYDGVNAASDAGNIIITKRTGSLVGGTFSFRLIWGEGKLYFTNGYFEVNFVQKR
jgi:hypothetical protein